MKRAWRRVPRGGNQAFLQLAECHDPTLGTLQKHHVLRALGGLLQEALEQLPAESEMSLKVGRGKLGDGYDRVGGEVSGLIGPAESLERIDTVFSTFQEKAQVQTKLAACKELDAQRGRGLFETRPGECGLVSESRVRAASTDATAPCDGFSDVH